MAGKLRPESGVRGYIKGSCTAENCFPVDWHGESYIDCMHCRYFRQTARRCGINGSIPEFPDRYIGSQCPMIFEEDEVIE